MIVIVNSVNASVGIELMSDGKTYHMWNNYHNYYIDANKLIQLTNHYQEYWTKNEWCIQVMRTSTAPQQEFCTTAMNLETTTFQRDNTAYLVASKAVNIYANRRADVNIEYKLSENDRNLTITTYVKNNGLSLYDVNFLWKVKDINIGGDGSNNYLEAKILQTDGNVITNQHNLSEPEKVSYTQDQAINANIKIVNRRTNENLIIGWNKDINKNNVLLPINYSIKTYMVSGQYNSPVYLNLNLGSIPQGTWLSNKIYWIDDNTQYFGLEKLYTHSSTGNDINNIGSKIAMSFKNKETKTINRIAFRINAGYADSPTLNVGIQDINSQELPSGNWVTRTTFSQTTVASWVSYAVPEATLTGNTVYAVVFDYNSGDINSGNKNLIVATTYKDQIVPFDNSKDLNYKFFYKNTNATPYQEITAANGKNPIFVICYTDGTCLGQPYFNTVNVSQYGTITVGTNFVYSQNVDYNTIGIWARCSSTSPRPKADLNIVIFNVTDNLLDLNSTIATSASCTTSYAWYTLTLTAAKTLTANKQYIVWFMSPDSNSSSYWRILQQLVHEDENSNKVKWLGTDSNVVFGTVNAYNPTWSAGTVDARGNFCGLRFQKTIVEIAPDMNVVYPINLEIFSPNSVIDLNFAFRDYDTNAHQMKLDVNYSSSQTQGTGTTIVIDQNVAMMTCDNNNFETAVRYCKYSWNTTGVSNGSYYIIALARDANGSSDFNSGNQTFTLGTADSCTPTINQDWVIKDTCVKASETIVLGTGKIFIATGGKLVLNNSTVYSHGLSIGKILIAITMDRTSKLNIYK